MKEFIFTWNIENISHSWHKKGEPILSPSFVADTLENTTWRLCFYPRGSSSAEWVSLFLKRVDGKGIKDYNFECELTCVSANNLPLISQAFSQKNSLIARDRGIGYPKFFRRQEAFERKKDLYLSQDTLKLRCRIWRNEGGVEKSGQCFGSTRLEIESAKSYRVMNPRINNHTKISVVSENRKTLLLSVDVLQQKGGLKITLHTTKNSNRKFSTFKFLAVGKNRQTCEFVTSWFVKPYSKVWRSRFLNFEKLVAINNKLKITCEFIYATGEETQSIEKVNPCSYQFPEFSSNSIFCCIPSGKLSDWRSICKDLWDLYEKQILCDVELKTGTTSFFAHKTVLCARSPVFLAMFTINMKERLTYCVEIKDLEDDTLKKLLKFLYTDSFEEIQWDSVVKLYYSADKYQVELLKHLCHSFFMNKIKDMNVFDLLLIADRHNDSVLRWEAENYIGIHRERIFKSSRWQRLLQKQPLFAEETKSRIHRTESEKENIHKAREISSYPNAMHDLKSVYHSQIDCDIVVQTLTNRFPAHLAILYAGSSMLKKMYASGKLTDSLKIEDLEDDIVSRLLLFLYTDSVEDINLEIATKLHKAAVAYEIERLRTYCSCFFLAKVDGPIFLQLAHEHEDVRLKLLAKDFISLTNMGFDKLSETVPQKWIKTRSWKRIRIE